MTHNSLDPRIERTRAAVTEAAGKLLLAHGPDAITHGRVATAANVSRTTVYKHWPERADLLRSTIEGVGKTIPQPDQFTGDFRRDLRTLLAGLASDLNDERHSQLIATMLARAQHDPTVARVRDAMFAEIHEAFDSLLTMAVANNSVRPDIDAHRTLASLGGALLFSKLLADRVVDDELLDAIIDDFIAANAPR